MGNFVPVDLGTYMGQPIISIDYYEQTHITRITTRTQVFDLTAEEMRHLASSVRQIFAFPRMSGKNWALTQALAQVKPWLTQKGDQMIGLDFETFGTRPLPVVGLDNYINDPTFRILLASVAMPDGTVHRYDFVLGDPETAREELHAWMTSDKYFAAHNAGFERAVLKREGFPVPEIRDSAVMARAMGAGSKLEEAAPQLLGGLQKMEVGERLIKKFSIPREDGYVLVDHVEDWTDDDREDWRMFGNYCDEDARLSRSICARYKYSIFSKEWAYEAITQRMNDTGWTVDVPAVREMQRRYLENVELAEQVFRERFNPQVPQGPKGELGPLNLNSLQQLKNWCHRLGVRATSFDEAHVAALLTKVEHKLETITPEHHKWADYTAVAEMLRTKQVLGGSSLKKLKVILDTVSEDGQLRNSYLHCGAGQTYRTTGRGVQMQNLPRLSEELRVLDDLHDPASNWTNGDMAENLRQVFTAQNPKGSLIVGDFASVESRGLAYLAGEKWKLDAYFAGKDMYKVLAEQIHHVSYDQVTKEQRRSGKVGELGCGYGAGGGAVASFAKGMGIVMTEDEATDIVYKWRDANPKIVELWRKLDEGLHACVEYKQPEVRIRMANFLTAVFSIIDTPTSLLAQHNNAVSIELAVEDERGNDWFTRVFRGCYMRGRDVCYYKPHAVNGQLWSNNFVDPKTKERMFYKLYGGKLAGILTQSFCREIFFHVLQRVDDWVNSHPGVTLVGQFHDEIILDFDPDVASFGLAWAMDQLSWNMKQSPMAGFPLEAEVKSAYRYTK